MDQKQSLTEKFRLAVLDDYNLSKSPDKEYNQITFLTATVCETPVAYLGIIDMDEIWFKSSYGLKARSIKKEISFSAAALKSGKELFSINYSDNPEIFVAVSKVFQEEYKFYTGVILKDSQGFPIAVLSILDTKERTLHENQNKALIALGNQSMRLIEFSKQNHQFQQIQSQLKQKYKELEKFASLVSHDIKSPLANIISLTELLKEENKDKLDDETRQYLDYLVESSYSLRNYVDGILSFYRSEHILEKDYENVDLSQLLKEIANLYEVEEDVVINFPQGVTLHNVNKAALTQVFLNLISNGLKYNQKKVRRIDIKFKEEENCYFFEVIDNGEGFSQENADKIFDLFTTLDTMDRHGNPGSGIGLATVKKLVESMGGRLEVSSEPGIGSDFKFSVERL